MGRTCRNASRSKSQSPDWSAKHSALRWKELLSLSRKLKPNGWRRILKLGNTLNRMRLHSRVHWHRSSWLMPSVRYIEVPFHTYIGPYWLSILWDQRVLGGDSRKIDWMAWSTSARVNPRSHQCMQVDKTQRPMHNATFPEKGHVFKILYRRYVNR